MNANADFFDWDGIPDQDVLPDGDFTMIGVRMEDKFSQSGKRMFMVTMKVEEPALYGSQTHIENFVTGTDEDPTGIVPGSFGTRNLKRMLGAAQIKSNSVAQLCQQYEGALFGVSVVEYEEKEGDYKGTPRNRITKYWKRGERQPAIKGGPGGAGKGRGPAQAAQAAAAAAMPTGAPSAAPAAPAPAAPAAPQQPAPPTPPAAPAPGPVAEQPAPSATAGVAPLQCSICNEFVPVEKFNEHVAAHMQNQ